MDAVINIEENIGKTVGRRIHTQALQKRISDIDNSKKWRSVFGGNGIRSGVYRFKTHEEANASQMQQMIRRRAEQ